MERKGERRVEGSKLRATPGKPTLHKSSKTPPESGFGGQHVVPRKEGLKKLNKEGGRNAGF